MTNAGLTLALSSAGRTSGFVYTGLAYPVDAIMGGASLAALVATTPASRPYRRRRALTACRRAQAVHSRGAGAGFAGALR